MSNKTNENKELEKIKEEILKQMKIEQKKFARNLEEKMDETTQLINDINKKFEENKAFFENVLSQKYYLQKLDNLDKISSKLNDSLLSHEIRISKNINEINSLRTKYDRIILDNLLIPGQIGPSCQFKNLAQYLKNNIYDMTRIKTDNENMKNLSNDLKIKFETNTKNITGLIENCVTRCNQFTDSRISDCISVLENKTKQMNEKLMEVRMQIIQKQDKADENHNFWKLKFEERIKNQDEKIMELNNEIEKINEDLTDEGKICTKISKLKHKLKKIKNVLLAFISNYQPPNNNNQTSQGKNRRNSMMGLEFTELLNSNLESILPSSGKNRRNESKDMITSKNNRTRELLSPVKPKRQSVNINSNSKFQSNQKQNIKLKMINISESSSDDSDNGEKMMSKKDKNKNGKNVNDIFENKDNNFNESKKNKNKSNRSNKLDKGSKNKNNIKNKNNKNASKVIKKDNNSNDDSFNSISDSSESDYHQEKNKVTEFKPKLKYQNKRINEKIMIQSKTINQNEKPAFHLSKTSNNSFNFNQNVNMENIISTNSKLVNTYQSFSRNLNNNNTLSNNQNSINNTQQSNFYRTQKEEKKEIIKDFFSKYDKNTIQENLSLIKNRGNLDLYNYSVSPPDNNHFLDTKQDEIYDPPLTKEFLFNKKNNPNNQSYMNTKIGSINAMKRNTLNIKINMGNNIGINNKRVGNNNSSEKKIFLNNNNSPNNSKFVKNKKMEFSNKFTNTYRNYFPENAKREKMYNVIDASKKG